MLFFLTISVILAANPKNYLRINPVDNLACDLLKRELRASFETLHKQTLYKLESARKERRFSLHVLYTAQNVFGDIMRLRRRLMRFRRFVSVFLVISKTGVDTRNHSVGKGSYGHHSYVWSSHIAE